MGDRRGKLIVFEGAEGVGKTTQLRHLASALEAARVAHLVVREPGGTPAGEEIRRVLLDHPLDLTAGAEALLFMASRAELVSRVIGPALAQGTVVLLDRFFLSTYAYQVAGRGLEEGDVRAANHLATAGLVPDLTLLFDLPVGEGLARADRRGTRDRIERAGDDFHARVDAAFRRFADRAWQEEHPETGPVQTVDARGGEGAVRTRVLGVLAARWPESFLSLVSTHPEAHG